MTIDLVGKRSFDPALLLIPLIGLVAVWSFVTQPMPSTDDGMLFMLRVVELDRCLRHGVLPLRWAPDFAHGYGYPLFNYYASLSSYIAEFWHLLGLSFPQAFALAMASAFLVSGWGAYLLGRDLAGSGPIAQKAGLVAATAYMYAPYLFYDSAYRGNLAETWALALLPWVLWTGRLAALNHRWHDIVPCAISYAALVYTHNVYTLLVSPLLGIYLLVLWWRTGHSWRDAIRLGAAISLGLALSAFFWLPMFFEKEWTHFSTDLVDYRTFFLTIGELLSWPPQVDLALLNYFPPRSLSWGMLILVGVSVFLHLLDLIGFKQTSGSSLPGLGKHKPERLFFLIVLALTAFMTINLSDFLWRTVPLLNFALIPWRYLGIASLAGALVAGTMICTLDNRATLTSPALIWTGIAIVLLVATSIPWTYAAPFPQSQIITVSKMMRWEYGTGLIGTTAKNEYLPIWSSRMPDEPADPALLTDDDPIVARLDTSSLPQGAQISSADYGLLRAELEIETPVAFRAIYKQFYFPGWRVLVDGQAVPQIATQPYGLLGFDVPAGKHRIIVKPSTTPLRLTGEVISILALLIAITIVAGSVLGFKLQIVGRRVCVSHKDHASHLTLGVSRFTPHLLALAALTLVILGLKEGIIDRTDNLFRAHRFNGEHIPGMQTKAAINLGNELRLHGYNLPGKAITAGTPFQVDLYLSASRAPSGDYMAYARLVDDRGRLWSLADNGAPEGFRGPPTTAAWPLDAYARWSYLVYSLPGTPPGTYWVEIAVFERGTWRGLNVIDARGWIVGQKSRIGPIQVMAPNKPPDVEALGIERPLDIAVGQTLKSLGSTLAIPGAANTAHVAVQAGDQIDVTLFWQAIKCMDRDYQVQLELVSDEGRFAVADGLPLGRDTHPTTAWEKDEIVRSPHRLRIPAAIEAGDYTLSATVIDEQDTAAAGPLSLAEITIKPTSRQMTIPGDIEHVTNIDLGNQGTRLKTVRLLGYDLAEADLPIGNTLSVTLYWQALEEMETSYKVFVQLLGPDGILTQADATPANWTRPTTGWIAGEVIVDTYALDVPKGAGPNCQLIVGLYDEQSLQRLAVIDGAGNTIGDVVPLTDINISAP
ncbi:MAG: hypothetical protein JXA89_17645 [Anaerolineae bacterium]|nr:hypothetical protein [Anaerolineae bacterium]